MTHAFAGPRNALIIGAQRPFGGQIVSALQTAGYAIALSFAKAAATLDLLVVNSPVEPRRIRFRAMTDVDFVQPLEQQLYEFVEAVQFAAPRMATGGSIVHVASKAHLGTWDGVDVAAAGGACVAMARSMALELAPVGIRVNTLAADYVGEPGDDAQARADLGATVAWLGGEASRLISGETILLNQGRSLQMALAVRF
jgi:NAD(P)-dependent dehydrogenase (short-subunit alcohol dehydrogenase family)